MTAPHPPPADLPQLMTYGEAAAALRLSVRTVARFVAAEQWPVRRMGARVFFTPEDLAQIVAWSLQKPTKTKAQRRKANVDRARRGLQLVEQHRQGQLDLGQAVGGGR